MITCEEAIKHLYEYLDNELPGLDYAKIEEHLVRSRKCCGRFEFEKTLRSILRDKAKSAKIPPSLRDRIIRIMEEQ